jgi:hypothetical protein
MSCHVILRLFFVLKDGHNLPCSDPDELLQDACRSSGCYTRCKIHHYMRLIPEHIIQNLHVVCNVHHLLLWWCTAVLAKDT